MRFNESDLVLVTKVEAHRAVKLTPFECIYIGPYTVVEAVHLRYKLRSSDEKVSRKRIHARRLRLYNRID